jgi:uncharacterized membrane protein YdjX (TVP38/TMEM64 family)
MSFIRSHFLKLIFLAVATIFFIFFFYFRLHQWFSYDNIKPVYDFFTRYSFLGPIILVSLFIVFNLFAMPTFYFVFISGYLYGPWFGMLWAMIGMVGGMMMSFINARYIFRSDFQRRFGENKMVQLIEKYTKKYHWKLIIFLRLVFVVPYNMQNVAYGLTGIHPLVYAVCSAIGIVPITIFYVIAGHLVKIDYWKAADMKYLFMVIGILLTCIISIIVISVIIKKRFMKEKEGI